MKSESVLRNANAGQWSKSYPFFDAMIAASSPFFVVAKRSSAESERKLAASMEESVWYLCTGGQQVDSSHQLLHGKELCCLRCRWRSHQLHDKGVWWRPQDDPHKQPETILFEALFIDSI